MNPIWAVGLVTLSLSIKGATGRPSLFSLSLCIKYSSSRQSTQGSATSFGRTSLDMSHAFINICLSCKGGSKLWMTRVRYIVDHTSFLCCSLLLSNSFMMDLNASIISECFAMSVARIRSIIPYRKWFPVVNTIVNCLLTDLIFLKSSLLTKENKLVSGYKWKSNTRIIQIVL